MYGSRRLDRIQSTYGQDWLFWLLLSTSGLDSASGPFKKVLAVSVQTQMVTIVGHKRIQEPSAWKPSLAFQGICPYPPSRALLSLSFPTCKNRRSEPTSSTIPPNAHIWSYNNSGLLCVCFFLTVGFQIRTGNLLGEKRKGCSYLGLQIQKALLVRKGSE